MPSDKSECEKMLLSGDNGQFGVDLAAEYDNTT